jgi:N-acetylglucosaminyl-diphospho-decaprenol L-rhamnosyltransferase
MISISLVSHGQMSLVYRLFESMERVLSGGIPLEIILIENKDRSIVPPKQFKGVTVRTLVNEKPCGLAKNHNRAFNIATGDYFCVINPDVFFIEDVFPILIDHLEVGGVDVVAPLVVDEQAIPQDSFRDLPTPLDLIKRRLGKRMKLSHPFVSGEVIYPDWIAGIFFLTRAETFDQLGGFNERYRLYFEDVDFSCRARLADLTLGVVTDCRIVHEARRASRSYLRPFLWHLLSAAQFFTSPVYWQSRALGRASK